MPKRIGHRTETGIEKKWCTSCKKWLALTDFHKTGKQTWDGLFYKCATCTNKNRVMNPRKRAADVWYDMHRRVRNRPSYTKRGVQITVSKADFIAWYIDGWFPHCVVDRIDNKGNYSLSNMQLITHEQHNRKLRSDNLKLAGAVEVGGKRWCRKCELLKATDNFSKKVSKVSKSNPLGLDEVCKSCRATEQRNRRQAA